ALFLALTGIPALTLAQDAPVKQVKLTRFLLQSSAVAQESGSELSSPGFTAKDYWYPVKVPCTVLTGLVANKVYPDPYIGMNNMKIPDASDAFNKQWNLEQYSFLPNDPNPWKKPYWYRTSFQVPASDRGKHFQLIFKGINYRADVWLNGTQVADSSQMVGMFAQYSLDVSSRIRAGGTNGLAVKIYPLDYPGLPSHPQLNALGDFYANGGPTGDIGKNVTMLCSVGWDWIPEVRDRNIGIWQPVYLRTSGDVVIQDPQIVTTLPGLPDTNTARIDLHFSLSNSGSRESQGRVRVTITPETFSGTPVLISRELSIPAGGKTLVDLNPDQVSALVFHHPRLWWPNGYGKPDLYRIRLQYFSGTSVSDDTSFCFGIRQVGSRETTVNGWARRDFFVNGVRIHLNGGAWVPDMMLNRDSTRYDDELRLARNGNVNLLRIWGGGVTPPDIFFDLADRYGLLVWQDFWVTGDTQGEFKGSNKWPFQGDVFVRNVISTILRIRNHPSLLVWTGGNEGHAREELYQAMRDNVASLDGTRPFIPCSSGFAKLPEGWKASWPDDQPGGVYSGGPYSWVDEAEYFRLVDRGRDWLFKDETGIPSQVNYDILPRMIPDLIPDSTLPYPLNNTWGYHDACVGNGHYERYYQAMVDRYGAPSSFREFSDKMQMVNAVSYRGIFESAGHHLNSTGGVILWKLNAAFPSVVWQVYDWYLDANAGYYSMQNTLEPVHVQLNLDDSMVAVVNRTALPQTGLRVEATSYSIDGRTLYHHEQVLNLDSTGARESFSLSGQLNSGAAFQFLLLSLKDKTGRVVSRNLCWMAPHHDYKAINSMPETEVTVTQTGFSSGPATDSWGVRFTNHSTHFAFFLHPKLRAHGELVLPAFWSTNYFSLAPGESLNLKVGCPARLIDGKEVSLSTDGWNVPKVETALKLASR
ncbi:MAG TPA: beta galactosidase jelly roll domain-containing protein, partial [Chitinophagaceae bacterium]|nr:beta galactosidase jelly roll domain-containing protein [Chitinophagaceae bacterium]